MEPHCYYLLSLQTQAWPACFKLANPAVLCKTHKLYVCDSAHGACSRCTPLTTTVVKGVAGREDA